MRECYGLIMRSKIFSAELLDAVKAMHVQNVKLRTVIAKPPGVIGEFKPAGKLAVHGNVQLYRNMTLVAAGWW